jgi:S1-C subfamily serine protease
VKIEFTFGSGARAGQTEAFSQPFVQIGRHPHCDLRFDADRDLDVSSRHATVLLQEEMFILRDLGSTNGTFVNGKRLTADHVLANGDEVQFGKQGPKVKVAMVRDQRTGPGQNLPPSTAVPKTAAEPPRIERSVRRTPPGQTTTRIKVEVARQTASLRRTTVILLGLLVLLAGAYLWQSFSASKKIERERAELLRRVDSIAAAYQNVQVNVASLQGALDSAAAETARLRARIGQGGDAAALAELRAQLQTAQRRQQSISAAASIDPGPINRTNRDGVGVVVVEFADGDVRTGSGFVVRSETNAVLVMTNRHVVNGAAGAGARRMGVIFNGSNQNFPAELVATHANPEVDLALIRVPLRGGIETVVSIAATVAPEEGEPVAIIGFPLGLDMAMGGEWQRVGVSTSLNTGTLSKVLDKELAITGYGAPGMSGSPVFNRQGQVIGIVFGGQRDSQGRVVLAVPVRFARELLSAN